MHFRPVICRIGTPRGSTNRPAGATSWIKKKKKNETQKKRLYIRREKNEKNNNKEYTKRRGGTGSAYKNMRSIGSVIARERARAPSYIAYLPVEYCLYAPTYKIHQPHEYVLMYNTHMCVYIICIHVSTYRFVHIHIWTFMYVLCVLCIFYTRKIM